MPDNSQPRGSYNPEYSSLRGDRLTTAEIAILRAGMSDLNTQVTFFAGSLLTGGTKTAALAVIATVAANFEARLAAREVNITDPHESVTYTVQQNPPGPPAGTYRPLPVGGFIGATGSGEASDNSKIYPPGSPHDATMIWGSSPDNTGPNGTWAPGDPVNNPGGPGGSTENAAMAALQLGIMFTNLALEAYSKCGWGGVSRVLALEELFALSPFTAITEMKKLLADCTSLYGSR